MHKNKLFVLGIPVNLSDNYLAEVKKLVGGHIITLNAEMVMLARQNIELAEIINQAELVVPDGSGVVLYGRSLGYEIHRCPGIELAAEMLSYASKVGLKVFFIGANPEVSVLNLAYWLKELPGLKIVGCFNGYFDQAEEAKILEQIKTTQPHFIFVALGVPKQEIWIHKNRTVCPQALWMGVGGSFDVWAGVKKRAPQWMGQMHLEWFYRLLQEPWRWRRMLVLPQFIWQSLLEVLVKKPPKTN